MSEESTACRISIGGSGPSREGGRYIQIEGLTPTEKEKVEGMLLGAYWIRGTEGGRIEARYTYATLPDPIRDPLMYPFWQAADASVAHADLQPSLILNPFPTRDSTTIPGIIITDLCGHWYSPERYELEAEKLKGYGFTQMRSERGEDGRFIEHWYLYGDWAAKGGLKAFIDAQYSTKSAVKRTTEIIQFLCDNCSFGTLNTVTQRAAMPILD